MSTFLLIVYCLLIFLDGMNCAQRIEKGNALGAILWFICAGLWSAVLILKVKGM